MSPFFSVIIPTYNRAKLLVRAVESVRGQTYADWELIIVDDGSTDDTEQICNNVKDARIKYLKMKHGGQSFARNHAIQGAKGQWLAFVDSDDECLPAHLEERKKLIDEHPGVDLIFGGIIPVGDPYVVDANDEKKKIHVSECILTAGAIIRKTVLIEHPYQSNHHNHEYEHYMALVHKGYRLLRANTETYKYIRQEDSITKEFERERGW